MEEERLLFSNFDETPLQCQSFQTDKIVERCINIPETILEQASASSDEDSIKSNASKILIECFPSSKANIANNSSVNSDESTVCELKPFSNSEIMRCEKKLFESSSNEEKDFELEKMPINKGKLLELSKKLKFLNETISTPPSALREQISILRKEMNEAYEFHDLEIQILNEERREEPETYAQLIEKYSTLLELYTSLKNEYEEYRRDQEKIRNELQSKTVDCLESLCSQIETSDNSLSSASFVSFNNDIKCSTMIGNFTEKETLLLHDVTLQTKDPLSETNIFKTPKCTPFKSAKKLFPQNMSQKYDRYDVEFNSKLMEVETTLRDKAKEVEKLEQRLFKIEDLSELLQNEFERVSALLKENDALKENLSNKAGELDTLTQKLFTEIISLNPGLTDSLADTPGTKLLPVLIETIMERCRNIEDKLVMKFTSEKSELETRMNNLVEANKNLNDQISKLTTLEELKSSYESKLLNAEKTILTLEEELRTLRSNNFSIQQMDEDLARTKEKVTRLENQVALADNDKKEMEAKYSVLEHTNDGLRLDLEKIKGVCDGIQNENEKLKERLSEATTEKLNLQEVCEQLKQQLSEYENVISQDKEIINLKNQEINQMKNDLTRADEVILKMKAELFTAETEKLNFEKQSVELENTISALKTLINTKDTILKDLEGIKSSCESEMESMKQQVKETEAIISDLKTELDTVKEKYLTEVKKTESLNNDVNSRTSAITELEKLYSEVKEKLREAENTILTQDEEIRILKTHNSGAKQISDDLTQAKTQITKLETELSLAVGHKKEMEDRYRVLEQTSDKLRLDLEKIKEMYEAIETENDELKERLSEATTEKTDLQEVCEQLRRQLSECKDVISSPDEEMLNLKNGELEQMKSDLAQANEVILKVKAELLTVTEKQKVAESEKLNFEKRCLELENTNATLQTTIINKETILKDLENFKSSRESEFESMKHQIVEKEVIISNFKIELDTVKEKYLKEAEKAESLHKEVTSQTSAMKELEKSYKEVERKLSDAEKTILTRDEEIQILKNNNFSIKQVDEDLARTKEEVTRLENQVALADNDKKEMEAKYSVLEHTNNGLRLDLEKIKEMYETIQNEKDAILKNLEGIKSSCENELENMKQQIKENQVIICDLRAELDIVKEKYLMGVKKTESLSEEINSKTSAFTELGKSYEEVERKLVDAEKVILTRDEEIRVLKNNDLIIKQMDEDLARTKEEVTRLETELSLSVGHKKEMEDKYHILEQTNESLCLDLEKIKEMCESIRNEKETILKNLEGVKSSCESEMENMNQQIKEKEVVISDLRTELETMKEKYLSEVRKAESLSEEVNSWTHFFTELEKSYKEVERKLFDAEHKIEMQDEQIHILIKTHDSNIKQMGEDLAQANEEVTKLQTQLSVANDQQKKMEDRYRVLEQSRDELRLDLEKIKEMYEAIENENDELKERLSEATTEKTDLQEVCEQLRRQLSECKDIISRYEEILNLKKQELEQIKFDLAQADEVLHKVKAELLILTEKQKVAESEKLNFEKRCLELENTNATLQTTIINKETILKDLENFKSSRESEFESMKHQIVEKEVIISNFKIELDTLREKYLKEAKKAENLHEEVTSQTSAMKELEKSYKEIERKLLEAKNKIQKKEEEIRFLQLQDTNIRLTEDDVVSLEGLEKLKLSSVKDFPKIMKKVIVHVKKFQSRAAELKEENEKLDEECDSYANVIKDLKKEAAMEWKKNNEKIRELEEKISTLTEMKDDSEKEKNDLLGKISKLEEECQRLKANILPEGRNCGCGVDSKKVNELKRIILVKEQKLLELQDLEVQNNSYKSQIEYLKNALEKERKKINEEREKNKKLQSELSEKSQNQKTDSKKLEENQILEELRMRGSISGGVVQEIVDKEKMRKLSKDVGVLKEICRARYAEIKRLEAENAALKNVTPKNSNQMDSPIRTAVYNLRSKSHVVDQWRTKMDGKENKAS